MKFGKAINIFKNRWTIGECPDFCQEVILNSLTNQMGVSSSTCSFIDFHHDKYYIIFTFFNVDHDTFSNRVQVGDKRSSLPFTFMTALVVMNTLFLPWYPGFYGSIFHIILSIWTLGKSKAISYEENHSAVN